MALALPSHIHKALADINPVLMDFWRCLQKAPDALAKELERLEAQFPTSKENYLVVREMMNAAIHANRGLWIHRSALFKYLNARCYNGLWRCNQQGYFNVPWGDVTSPTSLSSEDAKAYSALLSRATLHTVDFRELFETIEMPSRVTIYADPPYHNMFDAYDKDGFGESEQRQLANWLQYLCDRGARIWATNSDTPLIQELYSWARIDPVDERHSVGPTRDQRGKAQCVLIRG